MTAKSTIQNTSNPEKREKEIGHILALLKSKVEDFTEEVKFNQQFHVENPGVRTQLTADIEKTIENPFSQLVILRSAIDSTIYKIIDTLFKVLFNEKKEIIDEVYRSNLAQDQVIYLIIPKDDTIENRESIFSLLDFYDTKTDEFSSICPVNFQFIPKEFSHKIINAEKLTFDATVPQSN